MIKVNQVGSDKTIIFAVNELKKYFTLIDNSTDIQISTEPEFKNGFINIGICDESEKLLPQVADKLSDDAIYIDVNRGSGIITGTNPRSVLIAVYRFLNEFGVKFIRPGTDNEIIPSVDINTLTVKVSEQPSYRHREVCIEGSCSYEHISDLIDWLPKIGMNGYFIQFMKPYGFFNLWYEHADNPYRTPEPKTSKELDDIHDKLVEEMTERGLLHFAVGHTWNSEPLGIETTYWDESPTEPAPEIRKYLAEINGKRDWYGGIPLNTNLCYSNPEARELMINAVVDYAKKHHTVKYMVFWLADADGTAYSCQCDNCSKKTLSDWFVILINELDEAFVKNNIDCKLAVNAYNLTYWPPVEERINNPDRFVIMYSPIFRDFSDTFPLKIEDNYDLKLPSVEECDNDFITTFRSINKNVAFIKKWQEIYDGDSQMYDYQLMWFHQKDPGYMMVSENINKDMKALKTIGINGNHSCQLQRLFFPTALPMITMAETLWNRNKDFEEIKKTYLTDAFGKDGIILGELLDTMSQREIIKAMSGADALKWAKFVGENTQKQLNELYNTVEKLKNLISKNTNDNTHPDAIKRSWHYLTFYPEFAKYFVDVWMASYGENNPEKATKITAEFVDWLNKNDDALNRVLDCYRMARVIRTNFENKTTTQ